MGIQEGGPIMLYSAYITLLGFDTLYIVTNLACLLQEPRAIRLFDRRVSL